MIECVVRVKKAACKTKKRNQTKLLTPHTQTLGGTTSLWVEQPPVDSWAFAMPPRSKVPPVRIPRTVSDDAASAPASSQRKATKRQSKLATGTAVGRRKPVASDAAPVVAAEGSLVPVEEEIELDVSDATLEAAPMARPPRSDAARSDAANCVVQDLLADYFMRDLGPSAPAATFQILAYNARGERIEAGGERFMVAARGVSRSRTHVVDQKDGSCMHAVGLEAHQRLLGSFSFSCSQLSVRALAWTDLVYWKPSTSGTYVISVSLAGVPVQGSPFTVHVDDGMPFVPKCEVRGGSVHSVVSRNASYFEVLYRDRGGRTTHAVDLDVFVVPRKGPCHY